MNKKNQKIKFSSMITVLIISACLIVILLIGIPLVYPLKFKNDIASLEKRSDIVDKITLGTLAITLATGIASFYYKAKQNDILKQQREKDLLSIAQANQQSSAAEEVAALANQASAKANENAEASRERANNAELKSKELEKELIILRLAALDRFLPPAVQENLKKSLAGTKNSKILIQAGVSNSQEPMSFAVKLNDFFLSIGWISEVRNNSNIFMPPPTGIIVTASNKTMNIGKILVDELSAIRYKVSLEQQLIGDYSLIITVWAK